MGVLHSFSIKNIFHNKMDLRLLYFQVTIYPILIADAHEKQSMEIIRRSSTTIRGFL